MKFILFILLLIVSISLRAQQFSEHTVASGETLKSIANKYGITETELKNVNSGLDNYLLPGMVLKIPSGVVVQDEEEISILDLGDELKDVIYLKDGSELVAKISSISADSVMFEQYDTDELFSIPIVQINSITYEDGSTKSFPEPKPKNIRKSTPTKRRK